MRYALTTIANLLVLLTGIAIGVILMPHIEKHVEAGGAPAVEQATPAPQSPVPAGPRVTIVQPSMTTGTVGIYLVVSHHVQSDELVVNGYDLLKLQNAELGLLSRFVSPVDLQNAVNSARAGELYTVASPSQKPVTK